MSEPVCSCDEAKAWKAQAEANNLRATEAELSLRYSRVQLRRLLEHIDRVLDGLPGEDVVSADGEVIGRTGAEPGLSTGGAKTSIGARAVDWIASRMPKSERP